jgi:hypothetical protein
LIIASTVTAGNVGDGQAVDAVLLADELANAEDPSTEDEPPAGSGRSLATPAEPLSVYGDFAYGAGSVLNTLERGEAEIMCKLQPPNVPAGRWAKDAFQIDVNSGTVTCPIGQAVPLRAIKDGHIAQFRHAGRSCPLADQCTTSTSGRSIHVASTHSRRPLPTAAHPRSRAADRPGVEGRLQSHPPQSRTQDRSSDATAAGVERR